MKAPTVLATSLLVNLAIVGVFALRPGLAPAAFRSAPRADEVMPETATPVTRGEHASGAKRSSRASADDTLWSRLSTDDLPTLIARLRAAGFPPEIIRSVIQSQVAERYAARRREMIEGSADVPYWRATPGLSVSSARYEEYQQLQRESSKLLRDLLGDPYLATGEVSAAERRQFGDLPRATIDALQRIEADYAEMMGMVRSGTNGVLLSEDKAKLALLAREKRADLAALLSPAELADYEMRSSPITRLLGPRLGEFRASEAEFRAIFEVQKEMNERFPYVSGGSMTGPSYADRRGWMEDANRRLREQLGPDRFNDYLRETSDEFRQLRQIAQRENLSSEAMLRAFHSRDAVAAESARIAADASLSVDQKRAALATLAQNTRNEILGLLGPVAGPSFVSVVDNRWLRNVERGASVTFDGPPSSSIGSSDVMVSVGGGANVRYVAPPLPVRPAGGP